MTTTSDEIRGWFTGRLPDDWFTAAPAVTVDRDEILVVGELAAPKGAPDAGDAERASARDARVEAFRESTRPARMRIADDAQARFERHVSWGVRLDGETITFTTASVPVMTRLRMGERAVLDTLVDAGVARSRSEALGWCVKLVGEHEGDWIGRLREAVDTVAAARSAGPASARRGPAAKGRRTAS